MTDELSRARGFLKQVADGAADEMIMQTQPCSRVGDLLLAFESERVPEFYTMNYRESQAYCDVLGQNLAVRPNNPEEPERFYGRAGKPWPLPSG